MLKKKPLCVLFAAALLISPFSEAGRLGGGRSVGMSRSASPSKPAYSPPAKAPSYSQTAPRYNQPPAAQPYRPATPSPHKSGPGWGGVAAGAVAGAAAGYMLGHSNEATAQPANPGAVMQQQAMPVPQMQSQVPPPPAYPTAQPTYIVASNPPSSGFPWGALMFIGLLGGIGYWFYRKKQQENGDSESHYGISFNNGYPEVHYGTSSNKADMKLNDVAPASVALPGASGTTASQVNYLNLADGTETTAFLRQAKAAFLHLQTMNSPDSVDELRKYLTPDMFNAIKVDVAQNSEPADFTELKCEVCDTEKEDDRYIATVRFSGLVSESANESAKFFEELWHFVKPISENGAATKWLVAGIQQV